MRRRRILRDRRGFTLAEVLVAILILLIVTSIVAAGMPVAANAYHRVVDTSNAQVLLSTTVSTLRRELGTASDVELKDAADGSSSGTIISYRSANTGATNDIWSEDEGIMIQEYMDDVFSDNRPDARLLISRATSTERLTVTFGSVTLDKGVVTISNIKVMKNETELAEMDTYVIRTADA